MPKIVFLVAAIAAFSCLGTAGVSADEPNANAVSYATQANPETLVLDATQVTRGLMFSHMTIPVKPGPFTFVYPKWVPGEHSPDNPLRDISMLRVTADGRALDWQRDQVDLFAFHVDIPNGVTRINVDFDVLVNSGGDVMATRNIAIINWNRVLFYQNDTNSREVFVRPTLLLPEGWSYGTSLPGAKQTGNRIDFDEAALNLLIDSPLDMGRYYKHLRLWSGDGTFQELDVFADHPQDLDIPKDLLAEYQRMTPEAFALYGSRHWNVYHSLLTLSDTIGFQGIEHHQSSDDRAPDDFFTNPAEQIVGGDLLTHEYSHSWNGKYRRPFDLWQPNFQIAEHTELLWVYEGMNQYLGDLLSFRMGIRKPSQYPEYLATLYADMDTEPGRAAEPLIDLTTGAPQAYLSGGGDWGSLRRDVGDYYVEGELLWLDADTIIREQTGGKRSLDDFLHLYSLPALTGPITKTYTREDIESMLNQIAPYDWHGFFQRYVYSVSPHPPTDELARAGWQLVYNDTPNAFMQAGAGLEHGAINDWYGIGLRISGKGEIEDVREGTAAWNAGLGPHMTIIAVDGQQFDSDAFQWAVRQAQHGTAPIALVVNHDGWVDDYRIAYHGGLRYPHLVRIPGKPDMLAKIMAPHRH